MGQTAGNIFNPNVANPQQAQWGDLDPSEKAARLIAGGTTGLAKGFQNYQNQNAAMRQGGGGMGFAPVQTPTVDASYFQPQKRGPNNLSFYGDSNG